MPANPSEQIDAHCCRCGKGIKISEACAISRTFTVWYYCPPCYEIVAREDAD